MIHFFQTYIKDISNSPFENALKKLDIPFKIFSDLVNLRYKRRLWLFLVGWPKLIIFATKNAIRSLIISKPRPQHVVLGSDIEVVIFGLMSLLPFAVKPKVTYLGFIYTQRNNPRANQLRKSYFNFVFKFADLIVCYSARELDQYKSTFSDCSQKFHYLPFGLYISGRHHETIQNTNNKPYILTAGRSGRDYRTLFSAVSHIDIDLHVVCDNEALLANLEIPKNVYVLNSCYDGNYVDQIRNCEFVVIPLSVSDISAGQMVLIQAMAFAKPTIITKTDTTTDYVNHEHESILVPMGDSTALENAIKNIINDKGLASRLSKNALETYESKFSLDAHVKNVVNASLSIK